MEGVDRPDFSQFMANSTADENVMQFDKNNSINHNSSLINQDQMNHAANSSGYSPIENQFQNLLTKAQSSGHLRYGQHKEYWIDVMHDARWYSHSR